MNKIHLEENIKVGYYTFIYKEIDEEPLINETYVNTTELRTNKLSVGKLGEFAIFTADVLRDNEKADYYFQKTLAQSPKNAFWLGNYAIFLHYYMKNIEKAEKYYKKSLELDKRDYLLKYNYSQILLFYKSDYDNAEKLLKEIVKRAPTNSRYKCAYATFLFKVKKKFAQAETLCQEVLKKNNTNPAWLSTYAQLKILKGEKDIAYKYIQKALSLDPSDDLALELWFYLYAHFDDKRTLAEQKINEYIANGVSSQIWGLQENVDAAIFAGHPNPNRLEEIANILMKKK